MKKVLITILLATLTISSAFAFSVSAYSVKKHFSDICEYKKDPTSCKKSTSDTDEGYETCANVFSCPWDTELGDSSPSCIFCNEKDEEEYNAKLEKGLLRHLEANPTLIQDAKIRKLFFELKSVRDTQNQTIADLEAAIDAQAQATDVAINEEKKLRQQSMASLDAIVEVNEKLQKNEKLEKKTPEKIEAAKVAREDIASGVEPNWSQLTKLLDAEEVKKLKQQFVDRTEKIKENQKKYTKVQGELEAKISSSVIARNAAIASAEEALKKLPPDVQRKIDQYIANKKMEGYRLNNFSEKKNKLAETSGKVDELTEEEKKVVASVIYLESKDKEVTEAIEKAHNKYDDGEFLLLKMDQFKTQGEMAQLILEQRLSGELKGSVLDTFVNGKVAKGMGSVCEMIKECDEGTIKAILNATRQQSNTSGEKNALSDSERIEERVKEVL